MPHFTVTHNVSECPVITGTAHTDALPNLKSNTQLGCLQFVAAAYINSFIPFTLRHNYSSTGDTCDIATAPFISMRFHLANYSSNCIIHTSIRIYFECTFALYTLHSYAAALGDICDSKNICTASLCVQQCGWWRGMLGCERWWLMLSHSLCRNIASRLITGGFCWNYRQFNTYSSYSYIYRANDRNANDSHEWYPTILCRRAGVCDDSQCKPPR